MNKTAMTVYPILTFGFMFVLSGMLGCASDDALQPQSLLDDPPPQNLVGGPCTYQEFPGVAKIVRVSDADPNAYNCKDAVEVLFDFVPNDPQDPGRYQFPGSSDSGNSLTVTGGQNPARSWVSQEGITVGSRLTCIRQEITQGTCTPVIFSFPDLDFSKAAEECY